MKPLPILFTALTVQALSGCWLFQRAPEPPPKPLPPATRLAAWKLGRIGVVPFQDVTHQGVGARTAEVFARELARRTSGESAKLLTVAAADTGLLGIGQAQRIGKSNHADALLVGQVVTYQRQRRQNRFVLSVALRLLDTNRGSIIWSRTATGVVTTTADALPFEEAAARAAKEFIDDLLAAPPQANDRRGLHTGRRHGPA